MIKHKHTHIPKEARKAPRRIKILGTERWANVSLFHISIYVVTLFIGQIKTVLLNTSSLALRKAKTNTIKTLSFGAEKGPLQENGWLTPKRNPNSDGFQQSIFKEKTREICMRYYYVELFPERSYSRRR